MLFYVEYGCSQSTESLILDADDFNQAYDFAMTSAEELFDEYDQSATVGDRDEYESDDEYWDAYDDAMANDIHWVAEEYDEDNDFHKATFDEGGVYEIGIRSE